MSKDKKKVLKVVAGVVAGSLGLNMVPAMLPVLQNDQVGIFGVKGAEAEDQASSTTASEPSDSSTVSESENTANAGTEATSDASESVDSTAISGGETAETAATSDSIEPTDNTAVSEEENAPADETPTTPDTGEPGDSTTADGEENAPIDETAVTPDTSEPADNAAIGGEENVTTDETDITPETGESNDNAAVGEEENAPSNETPVPPDANGPVDNVGVTEEETVPAAEIVAPTMASDLGSKATAGEEKSFTVTTTANSYVNELVRVKITLNDPSQRDNLALQYQEINDGNYYGLPFDETGEAWYGPETGFPLGDISSNFKITFAAPGMYRYKLEIVKVADSSVLATASECVNVAAAEDTAAPTIQSDLGMQATVGEEKAFSVSTTAQEAAGELVKVKITLRDPTQKDNIALQYQELNDGNYYGLTFDENGEAWYGPAEGFPLGDISSNFKVTFAVAGMYHYKLELIKVSDGSVLASTSKGIKVSPAAAIVAPTLVSDLGNKAIVGEEKGFVVSTSANSYVNELVRVKITLSDPTQKDNIALQYQEMNDGNYYGLTFNENGEAWYGPAEGFPLGDNSSNFKVTFTAPGSYGYKLDLVKVRDGSVLASVDENVNVASYKYDVAISQLDVQNLKASVTAKITENDTDNNPVVVIFQLKKKISETLTQPVQLVAVNYDVPASGSEVKAEFNLPDTENYLVDVMVWDSFDVATAKAAKVTQQLP